MTIANIQWIRYLADGKYPAQGYVAPARAPMRDARGPPTTVAVSARTVGVIRIPLKANL